MNHVRRPRGDVARGLGALTALLGLVVGVPVGLVSLAGSPFPGSIPRWSAVAHALNQSQASDAALVKGAAAACWLAWAVLVMCVVVEGAAWIGGRTATRLPVIGPVQAWAGRLVASALLVFSAMAGTVRPATAVPVVKHPPVLRVVRPPEPSGVTTPEEARAAAAPGAPEPSGARRYVVRPPDGRRRDTLWGIAERHLGDPNRWSEVFALNKDRLTAGHRISSPHWIYPGEDLILPADARGDDLVPAPPAAQPPDAVPPPAVPAPAPAPAMVPAPPPPAVAAPTTTPSRVEMRVVPDDVPAPQALEHRSDGWRLARQLADLMPANANAVNLTGAGLLAAGVVAALDRRRRAQRRRQMPGAPSIVAEPELAGFELAVRAAADFEDAELVDLALRLLAVRAADEGRAAPTVLGVRVGARRVELTFVSPAGTGEPMPPFRRGDDGRWVLLARAIGVELEAAAEAIDFTPPALMTLGMADDGDLLVLNLDATGGTQLLGPDEVALPLLRAVATELANSTWALSGRLVLVGFGESLGRLPNVRAITGLDEIADAVDPGRPTVVLATTALPPDVLEVATVLARGPLDGAEHTLVAEPGQLRVDALGAVVTPPVLSAEDADAIVDLLHIAAATPPPPVLAVDAVECDDEVACDDEVHPSGEVEVRVLGPVEIVGAQRIARSKSVELIAYLAVHRDARVDADRLREALWPGRPPGTTLYTTASVARRHLGGAADGKPHFPHPGGDGAYRVGDSVATDYDRFMAAVRRARTESPVSAVATLREALELVRGRPFETTGRAYAWTHVEGYIAVMENDVATAAHALAQLCLDAGDAEGARWAARAGLRACPGNEVLYRDTMLAADLTGDRSAVEAVMNELAHVVEEEEVPFDSLCLHPQTVELYHRLISKPAVRTPA